MITYHKTFFCLGAEERLIDFSANNYDFYFGQYYHVTVHCLRGIFYLKLLILLFFIVTPSCKSGNFTVEDKTLRICLFGQWYTLCGNNLRYCLVKQYSDCNKYSLKTQLIRKGIIQHSITICLVYFFSQLS